MSEDLYAVLGVSPHADAAVIRAAYLALVRMHHPDGATGADARAAAEQRTKSLNSAYSVLGDPTRRAAYDERRRRPRPGVPVPGPARPASGRVRNGVKGRPDQRRGPSLQARRERLQRVRWASVALAVVALALLFGAITGLVGMLRPSWLAPRAPDFLSSEAIADSEVGEATPEVMLPWPEPAGGRARTLGAEGLQATFLPAKSGGPPAVQVSDTRGSKVMVEGALPLSSERTNLFGIGRLEGANRPAALIVATPAGEGCCLRVRVVYADRGELKVADLGEMPVDVAERYPSDLDDRGGPEWVLPDRRFIAAFGPSSTPPPMVFRFENGTLKDVSKNAEFGEIFSRHLAPAQRLCTLGSSGACAAFVASAARLGKAEWAWDIMLRNHGRDVVHEAGGICGTQTEPEACATPGEDPFPARLRRFLRSAGYVDAAIQLRADAAPSQ